MALTNAERQKRYRDRAREALRNGQTGHIGHSTERMTLPAAIASFAALHLGDYDSAPDPEFEAANTVIAILRALQFNLGGSDTSPEMQHPFIAMLGGGQYLRACEAWHRADYEWEKSRKRDKGPRPKPPAVT